MVLWTNSTEYQLILAPTRQAPKALLKAQKLAHITDSKIRIPFLGLRFGLDFLIGLIPVVGDVITLALAFSILGYAKKMGVPAALRMTMLKHIVLDFMLGLVPFMGDLMDLFYKANQKNVRIMEQWWLSQHNQHIHNHTQEQLNKWLAQQQD
jgi:hypothetical protein